MDARAEIREFLISRRARVSPAEAGLPAAGGNRRVPGLRREELASLAGVSISYYIRLERGDATGVSGGVLDAIARALRLDDAERTHLAALVHATSRPADRAVITPRLRPTVQRMLDSMTDAPAIIYNARLDIIGANQLARAAYWPMFETAPVPNFARYLFLVTPDATAWPDWDTLADELVAMLRSAPGQDPVRSALVEELNARSEQFRRRWAAHNVNRHTSGVIRYRHPEFGELVLSFESFDVAAGPGQAVASYRAEPGSPLTYESIDVAAEPGLKLKVYHAEPGSPSADALRLLATWYAGRDLHKERQGPA
ncbi:helix-turn-helix transcriptional regulator [Dactylosporangium sp. CA-092794]|uniref:helix-turn-helix transcriptional regulator n=1 Tax=Dactylosporangium sp. CA-092794 TaxID=3239929 RepID=UPI003D8F0D33